MAGQEERKHKENWLLEEKEEALQEPKIERIQGEVEAGADKLNLEIDLIQILGHLIIPRVHKDHKFQIMSSSFFY